MRRESWNLFPLGTLEWAKGCLFQSGAPPRAHALGFLLLHLGRFCALVRVLFHF